MNQMNVVLTNQNPRNMEEKGKYFFSFKKILFGEMQGKVSTPIKVFNNRIFCKIHCNLKQFRGEKKNFRFTFSLSSKDIEEIHIHFGSSPCFVAIETSSRFALFACTKIGRSVLLPESNDLKKRFIVLSGENFLDNSTTGGIEHCKLIGSLSTWTHLRLLSYGEACSLMSKVCPSLCDQLKWQHIYEQGTSSKILHNQLVRRLPSNEELFSFVCDKVRFGKLTGSSHCPAKAFGNRLYFTFNCVIKRKKKKMLEKYTFSVGPQDVDRVLVYVGQLPSFVIIETTKKFADVACNRIGQKVLSPGSRDPSRRYLFVMLHSSYNQNTGNIEEIISLFERFISPWTRLVVLSFIEAIDFLKDLL